MSSREIDLLLSLLDQAFERRAWHGPNLLGTLRGMTPEVAAYRASAKRHNVWELAVHAAYWKYAVRRRITGETRGSFPYPGSNWFARPDAGDAKELAADLKLLKSCHRELRAAVAALDPRRLGERVKTQGLDPRRDHRRCRRPRPLPRRPDLPAQAPPRRPPRTPERRLRTRGGAGGLTRCRTIRHSREESRMSRRRFAPVAAVAILAALSALGDHSAARAAVTVDVTVGPGNSFSPADVTIQAGDSVRWTNGAGSHNVQSDDGSFSSGAVGSELDVHPRLPRRRGPSRTTARCTAAPAAPGCRAR